MAQRFVLCACTMAGIVLGVAVGCVPGNAVADDSSAAVGAAASVPCEGTTSEKIDWISSRLDERQRHAQYWWYGFTGFYGIGTVVSTVQAATDNDSGDRAVYIVSAVKAAFGTTRLFFFDRPAALHGGDPVREQLPKCDHALVRGEELLKDAAHQTESRASWKRHASIIGINALGAVIAGEGWGDRENAWINAGVGIAVGEVMTWSAPWNGVRDLDEYGSRFGGTKATWQLVPTLNGLALNVQF